MPAWFVGGLQASACKARTVAPPSLRRTKLRSSKSNGQSARRSDSGALKHFRRVATRYDKLAGNFLAMVQLASMRLWLRTYESTA
jgi:transposase